MRYMREKILTKNLTQELSSSNLMYCLFGLSIDPVSKKKKMPGYLI